MKKTAFGVLFVGALLAGAQAQAAVISYTTGTSTYDNLDPVNAAGDPDPNGNGDTVILGAATGIYTGPGTYSANNVEFDVHHFDAHSHPTFTGVLSDTLSVAGFSPVTYYVHYSVNYNNPDDTLIVGGNSFVVDGVKVALSTLTLTGPAYSVESGLLTASVSAVPETSTWAMMLLGFAGLGFASYRSSRKSGILA